MKLPEGTPKEVIEIYRRTMHRVHNSHPVGTTLYYHDQYMNADRPGKVVQIVPHNMLTYYILEVEVPIIGDSFLTLQSEYQVRVTPKDTYKGR